MRDNYFTELKEAEVLANRLQLAQQFEPYIGKYYSHQFMRAKVLQQSDNEMKQIDDEIKLEKKNGAHDQPEEDENLQQ